MNLNTEPSIIGMANALDLDPNRPSEAIMEYCHTRVARYLRRVNKIANVNELQRLICKRLNLTVHEIWSDQDLLTYAAQYLQEGELAIFGALQSQFKPDTFGMLMQLQRAGANGRARFVTFIDCRGDKSYRRVFTLWHEIAHRLTVKDQLELPLRRTTAEIIEKDPIERLTDLIAGDFAFYEPLFRPIFETEIDRSDRLSFRIVERVRERFNPDASFFSTLNACVSKYSAPTILLEAALARKKSEQQKIDSGLAAASEFQARLRVARSIPNDAACGIFPHIPKKMRVPEGSIISKIHDGDIEAVLEGGLATENLQQWTTSSGSGLPDVAVAIEARKFGNTVIALVAPLG
ncbi:MAG: hypothetical protein P4L99_19890 [Chthoniobacter sp.]|nr:hypothetical protein [Chthoniobacter sp.]